jgi:prefoldin subunit 5
MKGDCDMADEAIKRVKKNLTMLEKRQSKLKKMLNAQ